LDSATTDDKKDDGIEDAEVVDEKEENKD